MANDVDININVKGNAEVKLTKLGKSVDTFSTKASKGFANTGRIFDNFVAGLAANAVTKAFDLLAGAVVGAARDFLEFDAAIAEVNSLLPANTKLTKESTQALIDFSSEFGGGAAEQAKAFYNIVSAGITDTSKALDLLEIANKAAAAGVTDIQSSVKVLTDVLATYEIAGIDAAAASDILFVAVREGKTTFGELSATVGRVAPLAAAAGVSFEELAGTLSFLTKAGISTDESVTSLRAIISSLVKVSPEAAKEAKELGIEFSAQALKSKGLAAILKDVREATGGNTETIAKLFPRVQALTGVLAITSGNFDEFNRILGETDNALGATDVAFQKISESGSFQFKILTQSIRNVGLSIANNLGDESAGFLTDLNASFTENIGAILRTVALAVRGLDVLATGFKFVADLAKGVVAAAFGIITTSILGFVQAINLVADVIPGFTSPLVDLEKTLMDLSDSFSETAQSAFDDIGAIGAETSTLGTLANALDATAESSEKLNQANQDLAVSTIESTRAIAQAAIDANAKIATSSEEKSTAELVAQERDAAQKLETEAKLTDSLITFLQMRNAQLAILDREGDGAEIARNEERIDMLVSQEKVSLKKLSELRKKDDAEKEKSDKLLTAIKVDRQKAANQALTNLASLQNSKDKRLRTVGKAAAISQTVISTFQGATAAFSALAGIPFVGPVLGAIAAAAAIVAGLANVARIRGTPLQGGITAVPQGFAGDTFPARLSTGERVVSAEQNQDLSQFLDQSADLGNKLDVLIGVVASARRQTIVNIGGREIIDVVQDEIDSGRALVI